MFGTILIAITTFMHIYVFLRMASIPIVTQHVPKKVFIGAGVVLWIIFYLGRVMGHNGAGVWAAWLEFFGMTWMALLFLIFICVFSVDIVTLFGLILPRLSRSLRGWAFVVGLGLSAIALFQGMRAPVIHEYEVVMSGLPKDMDGTVVVALSDMHLGTQIGEPWLAARIDQVQALHPDMIVLLGDIFEGHGPAPDKLVETMHRLSAPLKVWGVTGNHEYHGEGNSHVMKQAGIQLLRDQWVQVRPGLIMAGVDDISTRRRMGLVGDPISKSLAGKPPGATIFLSHSPLYAERAVKAGADLILSGHTHGGQIWPFKYLVQKQYPHVAGEYNVDGMPVIVCRGTGTWGPRMRLWYPGEILKITLKKPVA